MAFHVQFGSQLHLCDDKNSGVTRSYSGSRPCIQSDLSDNADHSYLCLRGIGRGQRRRGRRGKGLRGRTKHRQFDKDDRGERDGETDDSDTSDEVTSPRSQSQDQDGVKQTIWFFSSYINLPRKEDHDDFNCQGENSDQGRQASFGRGRGGKRNWSFKKFENDKEVVERTSEVSCQDYEKNMVTIPDIDPDEWIEVFKLMMKQFNGRTKLGTLMSQKGNLLKGFTHAQAAAWMKKNKRFLVFEKKEQVQWVSIHFREARTCFNYKGHNTDKCHNGMCPFFHICRDFISKTCPFESSCGFNHSFHDGSNAVVCAEVALQDFTDEEIRTIVFRSAPVVCDKFNKGGCNDDCPDLHVCARFIRKQCFDEDCRFGHILRGTDHNNWILNTFHMQNINKNTLSKMVITLRNDGNDSEQAKLHLSDVCSVDQDVAPKKLEDKVLPVTTMQGQDQLKTSEMTVSAVLTERIISTRVSNKQHNEGEKIVKCRLDTKTSNPRESSVSLRELDTDLKEIKSVPLGMGSVEQQKHATNTEGNIEEQKTTTTTGANLKEQKPTTTAGAKLKEQKLTTTAGANLKEQKTTITAAANLKEQKPTITAGANLKEQKPTTTAGANLKEQKPTTTAGANLTEQKPTTTAWANLTEQKLTTTAGANLKEQKPTTTAEANLTEQKPTTTAGVNLTEQKPTTTAGVNLTEQKSTTTAGGILKPQKATTTALAKLGEQKSTTTARTIRNEQKSTRTTGEILGKQKLFITVGAVPEQQRLTITATRILEEQKSTQVAERSLKQEKPGTTAEIILEQEKPTSAAGEILKSGKLTTTLGASAQQNLPATAGGVLNEEKSVTAIEGIKQEKPTTTAGAIPKHSATIAGAIPKHSATTTGAIPKHSATTAEAIPKHSATTAGAVPKHSLTTAGAIPKHSAAASGAIPKQFKLATTAGAAVHEQKPVESVEQPEHTKLLAAGHQMVDTEERDRQKPLPAIYYEELCEQYTWKGSCHEGNQCLRYHHPKRRPFFWQLHVFGSWHDLSHSDSLDIEEHFCARHTGGKFEVILPGFGGLQVSLVFSTMKAEVNDGTDSSDPTMIDIRRWSIPSYVDAEQGMPLHMYTQWLWYCQTSRRNFQLFSSSFLQYTLEEKYLRGQQKYYFENKAGNRFLVLFREMKMVCLEEGPVVDILRRPFHILADPQTSIPHMSSALLAKAPTLHQSNLPGHWCPVDHFQDFELVELASTSAEYRKVEKSFHSTIRLDQADIIHIFRIQNASLWDKFCSTKRSMAPRDGSVEEVRERQLFHGTTSLVAARGICTNSMDFRRAGQNVGTKYGRGSYFSTTAAYSHHYTKGPHRFMFLAKVLVGEYTEGDPSYKSPPVREGLKLYDSCVNNEDNPTIFVIFDLAQCYPEYLIQYEDAEVMSTGRTQAASALAVVTATSHRGQDARPQVLATTTPRVPAITRPSFGADTARSYIYTDADLYGSHLHHLAQSSSSRNGGSRARDAGVILSGQAAGGRDDATPTPRPSHNTPSSETAAPSQCLIS